MRRVALLTLLFATAAHADYAGDQAAFRAAREAELRADDGWLTVAGLFWLKPGANRFGTAADNEIILPAGADHAGVFELKDGKVSVTVAPGVAVTAKGATVKSMPLRPDDDLLTLGRLTLFVIERGERIGIRMRDRESPARQAFAGLSWFPVNEKLRVTARFVPTAAGAAHTIAVPNVLGQVLELPSPGRAVFAIGDGKEVGLDAILEEPDAKELFFIVGDGTTGVETYPGGRFLYSELPKDGKVVLDFNQAINPPCVFTSFATCPLPPKQNRLDVRLVAGEKYPPPRKAAP